MNSLVPPTDAGPPPRASWRRWVQLAVALFLIIPAFVAAAWYVNREPGVKERLLAADPRAVVVMATALGLVMVQNGAVLRALVAQIGVRLPVRTWLGITFVASMLNLISPVSGAGAMRGLYLKRMHDVPLTTFAGLLAVMFVFSVSATGAVATLSLLALGLPGGPSGLVAFGASAALSVGPAIALFAAPRFAILETKGNHQWLRARLAQLTAAWDAVRRDRLLVARLIAWNTAGALLHGAAFVAAFRITGFEGAWLVPIASSAFARIGALVSITPAGLGVYEAFAIVSAQIVGSASSQALLAVLLVRVLSTTISVMGGAIFSPLLLRGKGNP